MLQRKLLIIVAAIAVIAGCTTRKPYQMLEGVAWNTTFHIIYSSSASLDDSIHDIMRQVELSISPYCDSSTISKINRNESMITDSMFRKVFLKSKHINNISQGAFDPTIAPIINLWGFGSGKAAEHTPSQHQIDSALQLMGIDECFLTPSDTIVKKHPGTEFDFSAIAKGYGCDAIAEMMRRNGCLNFMIEVGGEIVVDGNSPRGTDWNVMIDAPLQAHDSILHDGIAVISVTSCAIATSGNYRNFRNVDGAIYGHSISPSTGRPAENSTLSVTVVAPECITADALATACMVMNIDSAINMIERIDNVSALFVTADENGQWQLRTTSRFPKLIH